MDFFKFTKTDKAPEAIGPYSQAIKVMSRANTVVFNQFVYLSGQIPLDPKDMKIVGDNIVDQTKQVFKNIDGVLSATIGHEGLIKKNYLDKNHIVKTTCFLKNMDDFEEFNKVYAEYFGDHKPARSCVEVSKLPKDALVEIEVIAAVLSKT